MSKVKLGDITTSCLGKMLDAKKNKGEFHPYLANINVRWGAFDLDSLSLMKFEEHEHERYGLQYGDLVMCEGGEPGRCAIWKNQVPDMKIQKALHRLRAKEGLDIFYLYYWFLFASMNNLLSGYFTETTIKHLSGVQLKELELDLPIFEIQKGVTGVLKSIDDKIELNIKINQELEEMAKTLYDYWFAQFDFPDEQGKPYRSSGGKMVFCEDLNREIPEGWGVGSVTSNFDVCYGYPFDTNLFCEEESQVPIVRIRDILDCSTSAYSTEKVDNKYKLSANDLVIGMDGNFHMNFWDNSLAYLNQRNVRIRSNSGYSALFAYFSIYPYIRAIEKSVTRTTVGHLSAEHVNSLRILLPTKAIKEQSNAIFNKILYQMTESKAETRELTALRDWLLPMLMNGQAVVGK